MADDRVLPNSQSMITSLTSAIITSVTNTAASEQLPTEAAVNPWDVPGPDGLPPSTRIAGGGNSEITADDAGFGD